MKTARISSLLGSSSASNPFDVQARMPKLPPLSGQHLSTDRAEALLTWRPQNQIEGLELGYNEPVKLRHGNAFSLDRRQKKIFTCVQELLSPSNFVSFSSVSGFRKPGLEPTRTVDQIELCNALTAYKLLENKITHERVVRLEAICKADAVRIFKKHTRNDVGGHVPRLSQVCAIVMVFVQAVDTRAMAFHSPSFCTFMHFCVQANSRLHSLRLRSCFMKRSWRSQNCFRRP